MRSDYLIVSRAFILIATFFIIIKGATKPLIFCQVQSRRTAQWACILYEQKYSLMCPLWQLCRSSWGLIVNPTLRVCMSPLYEVCMVNMYNLLASPAAQLAAKGRIAHGHLALKREKKCLGFFSISPKSYITQSVSCSACC